MYSFSQENQVNYSLKTSSKLKLGACTMALWRKVIAAPAEDLSWVPSANTECPHNSLDLKLKASCAYRDNVTKNKTLKFLIFF